jgi:hypothetical protein
MPPLPCNRKLMHRAWWTLWESCYDLRRVGSVKQDSRADITITRKHCPR